ncbi:MAG: pentapeptide repeat-containing protein, partial [bacterium]|nr:pentapeptide repeat-containing protein [bacterium]
MWRYLTTSVTLIIILVLTTHAKTKLFGNMNYPYSKIDTVSATSVFDCLRDASWSDTVGIHNCVILGPLQFSNKDDLNSGIDTIRCFWWCERSRFRGKIKLYRTYFNAIDFFDVSFDSVVDFHHTIFQDSSNFNRSIFNKEVNFNFSTFNNKASFGGSEFVDKADFSNSCFRDTILSVNFSCRFNKEANFSYTSYAGQSEFRNSEFYKRTDFGWSRFFADCNFLGSHFYDVADFENSQFLKGSTLILANSIIDRQFILTKPDTTWFTGPSNPAKPWNGPFLFCDSSSLLITDASFSPGNIVLTWDGFKNSSGYRLNYRKGSTLEERHRDYTIMMENFKARGDWPSYDLCFLEWKKLELEIESFSLKYLL